VLRFLDEILIGCAYNNGSLWLIKDGAGRASHRLIRFGPPRGPLCVLGSSEGGGFGASPEDLSTRRKSAFDPNRNRRTCQRVAGQEPAGRSRLFLGCSSVVPRLVLDWCSPLSLVHAEGSAGSLTPAHPMPSPVTLDGPPLATIQAQAHCDRKATLKPPLRHVEAWEHGGELVAQRI
jgi:hypothetical protein